MGETMKLITADEIYHTLLDTDKENLRSVKGQIRFHLGDVSIIVKQKDVVGNILQEWLDGWLTERGYAHEPNPNSQMPPDIYLDPNNKKHQLLEVKAFNRESSPAFDIADFKAFTKELIEKPYHLDTDFIIFGYVMDESNGDVIVKDVWLKKIWEIMKTMNGWPITVQYKNDIVQKMRPGNWFSSKSKRIVFQSKEHFLSAFEQTVWQCPETKSLSAQWRNRFLKSYENFYNSTIDIPRWDDIKDIYNKH